ncbi:MAG TPA: cupin domain-containing protein [Candidatus Dormibacteraeota bacterium]
MSSTPEQTVRRVVTGVDHSGKSVVITDEICPRQAVEDQYITVDLWTSGLPAPVDGPVDIPQVADVDPEPGEIIWRWFALGPGERIEFHKTETVDCMLVHSGSVTLLLEEGSVSLRPGDCAVQRGTRHGWLNEGSEPCVLVGTMASTRRAE